MCVDMTTHHSVENITGCVILGSMETFSNYNGYEVILTPAEFRCLCEQLGLTPNWLAKRWGVALQTVYRWERNRVMPPSLAQDMLDLKKSFDSSVENLAKKYTKDTTLEIPAIRDNEEDTGNEHYPQRMVRAIAWAVHEKTGCKIDYLDGAWDGKYGRRATQ